MHTLQYITLDCTTLHYITLHYITLRYITYVHTHLLCVYIISLYMYIIYIHVYIYICMYIYIYVYIYVYVYVHYIYVHYIQYIYIYTIYIYTLYIYTFYIYIYTCTLYIYSSRFDLWRCQTSRVALNPLVNHKSSYQIARGKRWTSAIHTTPVSKNHSEVHLPFTKVYLPEDQKASKSQVRSWHIHLPSCWRFDIGQWAWGALRRETNWAPSIIQK